MIKVHDKGAKIFFSSGVKLNLEKLKKEIKND